MDGRTQEPVISYLKTRFISNYVDNITLPGPCSLLQTQPSKYAISSLITKLSISIEKHNSKAIAVVAHHDCAGNPVSDEEQIQHIKKSVTFLKLLYPKLEIIGLWLDNKFTVQEV
jgi:hypothetical protein